MRWTVAEAGIPLPELSARLRAAASANGRCLHVLSCRDLSATLIWAARAPRARADVKLLTLIPRGGMLEHKYLYEITVLPAGPATSLATALQRA